MDNEGGDALLQVVNPTVFAAPVIEMPVYQGWLLRGDDQYRSQPGLSEGVIVSLLMNRERQDTLIVKQRCSVPWNDACIKLHAGAHNKINSGLPRIRCFHIAETQLTYRIQGSPNTHAVHLKKTIDRHRG